jgi:hypothetical protein
VQRFFALTSVFSSGYPERTTKSAVFNPNNEKHNQFLAHRAEPAGKSQFIDVARTYKLELETILNLKTTELSNFYKLHINSRFVGQTSFFCNYATQWLLFPIINISAANAAWFEKRLIGNSFQKRTLLKVCRRRVVKKMQNRTLILVLVQRLAYARMMGSLLYLNDIIYDEIVDLALYFQRCHDLKIRHRQMLKKT